MNVSMTAPEKLQTNLIEQYQTTRAFSEELCAPLETEDYVIQSSPDVSPTKWHLAHTTWFWETFLLLPYLKGYQPLDDAYAYLFNSYYNGVGEQFSRPHRGTLSRPTVREVYAYRDYVDKAMKRLLATANEAELQEILPLIEVGINHEQQHQELMLTDILHVFSCNPLAPVYREARQIARQSRGMEYLDFPGGLVSIGHEGTSFAYDNESPRHQVYLQPFRLADRLVTNAEYRAFMDDGGYQRPELWLSDGWDTVQAEGWSAPLYWRLRDGKWWEMTLNGLVEIDDARPVSHVSYFEAWAYARWAGCRLPTEAEWEVAACQEALAGNFVDSAILRPTPAGDSRQFFGDVWEWTASPYSPYPGYAAPFDALGEYNGKFMCNQFVLRGGSCATSKSHIRRTYRNFFHPDKRWQFTGIRLAKDAAS